MFNIAFWIWINAAKSSELLEKDALIINTIEKAQFSNW